MLCFPNSKINIGLNVIEKRPDGFHNIETIFYPISLCDALEINATDTKCAYQFNSSGIPIHISNDDNIVVKAFNLLMKDFNIPSTAIHLHKNIPFGAGLGGGSADAAFMIKMLNENYQLGLQESEMENYALKLGSDCPFFIRNKPVYAEGKGEIFTQIDLNLDGYYIILIKPDISISTPEAYAGITPERKKNSLKKLISSPISTWKNTITNDFENNVFRNHPLLAEIKKELYQEGAIFASMSGSGSSMFGIFESKPVIQNQWKQHFTFIGEL